MSIPYIPPEWRNRFHFLYSMYSVFKNNKIIHADISNNILHKLSVNVSYSLLFVTFEMGLFNSNGRKE